MKHSGRIDLGAASWRKSSYSNGDGADCVEVADNVPGLLVPVRDSKAGDGGPAIVIPAAAWGRFVAAVKADAFTA